MSWEVVHAYIYGIAHSGGGTYGIEIAAVRFAWEWKQTLHRMGMETDILYHAHEYMRFEDYVLHTDDSGVEISAGLYKPRHDCFGFQKTPCTDQEFALELSLIHISEPTRPY